MAVEPWVPSDAGRPIWSLASGYASARRRRHPLWMLEVYIDDSGIDQKPVLALAGFLSTAERWALFNEEWQEALEHLSDRKRGGPKRLKMAAAMSARARGSENRALWDTRLARFQSIIERYAIMGVGCVVELDAFQELFHNNRVAMLDHAYHIAFTGIIAATVRHYKKLNITDKIDFVFDRQSAHFDQSNKAFLELWKDNPDLMKCVAGSPRWADDDQVLPLQAAEWLVWQIRKNFASERGDMSAKDNLFITNNESHGSALKSLPIFVDVWDRQRMKLIRDEIVSSELSNLESVPESIRHLLREHLERLQ